jgi:hypothetical protein
MKTKGTLKRARRTAIKTRQMLYRASAYEDPDELTSPPVPGNTEHDFSLLIPSGLPIPNDVRPDLACPLHP